MDEAALRQLLDDVRTGACAADDAVARLRRLPFTDLGFARVDHHRSLRQVSAEAVYGPGKTPEQCAAIVAELLEGPGAPPVLLTRSDEAQRKAVLGIAPQGTVRGVTVLWRPAPPRPERVVVATAGTADGPVAEECTATLEAHGVAATRLDDVGVAGLHRLLASLEVLDGASAVVVAAGMEGALASVIGGITAAPVVAVPTSAGYGAGLDGVTALLSMLSSCAAGVSVVGIDNGFGAASAVLRLLGPPSSRGPAPSGGEGTRAGDRDGSERHDDQRRGAR
jgi:pyridinium-3,5-biscarboxylic acid mononucleotide synthase